MNQPVLAPVCALPVRFVRDECYELVLPPFTQITTVAFGAAAYGKTLSADLGWAGLQRATAPERPAGPERGEQS
ncbi:hypothetical protein [Streptomyces sp. NPDC059651]|uniref:hypothetical protein n=1 Tax=Streptomyces sp. NPDC059651 TaxID=3346897 RepID=UPI00368DF6FB